MANIQHPMNRVALITGSGKHRVGNVVAEALAARGMDIALHYRTSEDEARESAGRLSEQHGVRVEAFQADVSREQDVARMFEQTGNAFGRLDVLVTAAAVWEPKPLDETTAEDVRRQFDINTLGTFLCCQHGGRMMVAQEQGGAIVTIGDWAVERPYLGYAAYFASKGAIPALTRTFAIELAERNRNIRVNCIQPGPVMLPPDLSKQEVKGAVAGTVLKRPGSPENVAQAVVALVENDYVTGTCLPVDGGRTIGGAG